MAADSSHLVLAGGALLLAFPLGVLMGVLSAARPGSRIDRLSQVVAMIGISMPAFWVGLLLIIGFSVRLGWLPGRACTRRWATVDCAICSRT